MRLPTHRLDRPLDMNLGSCSPGRVTRVALVPAGINVKVGAEVMIFSFEKSFAFDLFPFGAEEDELCTYWRGFGEENENIYLMVCEQQLIDPSTFCTRTATKPCRLYTRTRFNWSTARRERACKFYSSAMWAH